MNFNWLNMIAAIPQVIQAIQLIHADAPGTTKKTKAMQWLGLGEAVIGTGNPQLGAELQAATTDVSLIIDRMVSLFHHTNAAPGFGVAPIPAPPAVKP